MKVEDVILDSSVLNIRVLTYNFTQNFQRIERISKSEFNLFLTNSTDSFVPIIVQVFELLSSRYAWDSVKIFEENFTLIPDFSNRRVWFDFTSNTAIKEINNDQTEIKIFVNESTSAGFVIEQFIARTTYLQDLFRIRYIFVVF